MKEKAFDKLIKKRWSASINPPRTEGCPDLDNGGTEFEEYEYNNGEATIVPYIEDMVDANGQLLNHMPAYNPILNAEVSLEMGEEMTV
jgi:hypothetical protein